MLEVAESYNRALTPATVSYLSARGIDEQAADGFLLGLVADPGPEHEPYRGRLSIPYITLNGVRTIKFRCLGSHDCKAAGHPKYLYTPGSGVHLYNVGALLQGSDVVAICEGELDAVVCSTAVGIPAVGVPGVDVWGRGQRHFPRLFQGVERVVIVTDNDRHEDGRNPGAELAGRIARDIEQAVVIQPPPGHDLTEWVLRDGADAVREKLQ